MDKNITWAEVLEARHRREDEPVARRFAPWKHLGCGHMRPDLCWKQVQESEERGQ